MPHRFVTHSAPLQYNDSKWRINHEKVCNQFWFGLVSISLTGCAALTPKTTNVEYYRIFDIKTTANRKAVSDAASQGLAKNVNNVTEARPIPTSGELPEKPGRFKLTNLMEGSRFAALAGSGGSLGFKVASCEGSVWNASATRDVKNSSNLRLTACLFPYKDGYHLNFYAAFQKKEGGGLDMALARSMAGAMVGSPEEWTEKTFLDVVRSVRLAANAEVKYIEGEPEMSGTPWLDSGETIKN